MNVQGGGHISADTCAIVQRHATPVLLAGNLSVDDDPDHGAPSLSLIAHIDQLYPMSKANWVDQLHERLC